MDLSLVSLRRCGPVALSCLAAIVIGSALSARATELYGSAECRLCDDTLYVDYSLRLFGRWDEVAIQLLGDSEQVVWRAGAPDFSCPVDGCTIEGTAGFARSGDSIPRGCHVIARALSPSRSEEHWVEFSPYGIVDFTFLPPVSFGYQWSKADEHHSDQCLAFGAGLTATYTYRNWQVRCSYSGMWGSDFAAQEIVPLAARRYVGNRNRLAGSVELGTAYSTLRVSPPEWRFDNNEWGAIVGAAIDGPFERLSYRYCSALDGYHTVGLSFATFRTGNLRLGTTYEYVHYEHTEMFRVLLMVEGLPTGGGIGLGHGSTDLDSYNNRPWWHKALSVPALVPAVVVVYAIGIVFGGLGGE